MRKVIKDLSLGFRLVFYAKNIEVIAIIYLVALVLGFVILTGSAIERNIYDDVLFIFLGLIAYCIGCHGILTSYNRVICSGFLLVCPRSKQIQIRIPMEMSMAMSLAGFTLMVLVSTTL